MANNSNPLFVVQHPDGWAVKKPNAARASAVLSTKKKAVKRAKAIAVKATVHVQRKDGKFSSK